MTKTNTILIALSFAALVGCADSICTLDRPEVGSVTIAIVGGTPSTDSRSTVRIISTSTGSTCTGTKVGTYTVLTAAHCVNGEAKGFIIERAGIRLGVSEEFEVHPAYGKGGVNLSYSKRNEGDLALIWTDFAIPGPVATVAEIGEGCYPGLTAQGYGRNSDGVEGNLEERTVYEVRHNYRTIFTTEGNCYGDSGGGLYAETPNGLTLIGVSSFVRRAACGDAPLGAAGYTNLLHYGSWVKERAF